MIFSAAAQHTDDWYRSRAGALTLYRIANPDAPQPALPKEDLAFVAEQLERWLDDLDLGGASRQTKVRSGDPRREILRQIEVEPPDLVIVGTHGRSGFERFLLGSVSEAVVRQAPASVLVVPPPSAAAEEEEAQPAPGSTGRVNSRVQPRSS